MYYIIRKSYYVMHKLLRYAKNVLRYAVIIILCGNYYVMRRHMRSRQTTEPVVSRRFGGRPSQQPVAYRGR